MNFFKVINTLPTFDQHDKSQFGFVEAESVIACGGCGEYREHFEKCKSNERPDTNKEKTDDALFGAEDYVNIRLFETR